MKAYLLSYSVAIAPDQIHNILNNSQAVETWLAPLPYSAVVVSRLTVSELAAVVHSHLGETWFVIVETNRNNCNGWLPKHFWDYMLNPQTAGSIQLLPQALKDSPPPPPPLPSRVQG